MNTKNLEGLTMRDWFAAQASEQDINKHMKWIEERGAPLGVGKHDCTREEAKYRYADAMLAARNKQDGR